MTVVEYRDKFLSLARYAPDELDTQAKKKERFLNGLHDEIQTVLVNIPFADIEALVDSSIQMEGKINQANENRKHRMMHQPGTHQTPKYRPNPSPGFAPRTNKPLMNRPTYPNRGNPRPGGNHNNPDNSSNFNRAPPKFNNNNATANTNTAPRTGSNAVPVAAKDKSQVTCYDCGNKGHYSNECPNKKNATAPNANVPAQQQRRVQPGRRFSPGNSLNRNGRLFLMHAEEAQEAPDVVLGMFSVNSVLARVLFDSGASYSFVTEEFACTSKIQPNKLKHVMIYKFLDQPPRLGKFARPSLSESWHRFL